MSYNPYNQGPGAEAGYGYGQPEQHEMQSYGQQQGYGQQYGQEAQYGSPYQEQQPQQQQGGPPVLSQSEFLQRVSAVRQDIQGLTVSIQNITTLHQQALASSDNAARQALDDQVAATQLKNTAIRGQIQQLKADTERTRDSTFALKKRQFESLNGDFKETIQRFLQEEQQYKQRCREQIARQYRIVNPDATEQDVQQAVDADWGDEGIFQTALRTNRSGQASAVLGNVRARHNDMLKIERSIVELLDLLAILNEQIVQQGEVINEVDRKAEETTGHLDNANVQIEKGVQSARRARKLKWWCLGVCVLIVLVIALGVGLGVALTKK
ncbi:t-SNARE [Staphylotrichum tortipilum]|uniref:t-SNARE n=1 Tax=Staphylotrichum tortipilum TaxID=2831512 RepID=A0AAN6RTF1_9PEZI|nr:t-SNARE [Staphylotrichum longicolle]